MIIDNYRSNNNNNTYYKWKLTRKKIQNKVVNQF